MSETKPYYVFSGHALGLAAHFHRLDHMKDLNHLVPTQAGSVLSAAGGLSRGHASNYCFEVDEPRRRTLISLRRADTVAEGRCFPDRWETQVSADIEAVRVLEKLSIGRVKLHMKAVRKKDSAEAEVSTNGSFIEGLQMGGVTANIAFDHEPLTFSGSKDSLAAYYRGQSAAWRDANARRFYTDQGAPAAREVDGAIKFSLAREIELSGTQDPEHEVRVERDGYTIKWDGFGRIIIGEVFVKCNDRKITMVRLEMGSDGGGSGTVGQGQTNGQTGTN
jgi:hypothetical protein